VSTPTRHADPIAFRRALARFASGVTIVTTLDADGRPWGLTATAFSSVSLDPPMVMACVDKGANCYPAFGAMDRFVISILRRDHRHLALRFASKCADKFAEGGLTRAAGGRIPEVNGALASLRCTVQRRVSAGDHMIVVGTVTEAQADEGSPILYFDGAFHELTPRAG